VNLPIILANLILPSGFFSKDVCLEDSCEITSQVNGLVVGIYLNSSFLSKQTLQFQVGIEECEDNLQKKLWPCSKMFLWFCRN